MSEGWKLALAIVGSAVAGILGTLVFTKRSVEAVQWSFSRAKSAMKFLVDVAKLRSELTALKKRLGETEARLDAKIDALEQSIRADIQQLGSRLVATVGSASVSHAGFEWAFSEVNGQAVPHCRVCFVDHSKLYPLQQSAPGPNGELALTCPKCGHHHSTKVEPFNHHKGEVTKALIAKVGAPPRR